MLYNIDIFKNEFETKVTESAPLQFQKKKDYFDFTQVTDKFKEKKPGKFSLRRVKTSQGKSIRPKTIPMSN